MQNPPLVHEGSVVYFTRKRHKTTDRLDQHATGKAAAQPPNDVELVTSTPLASLQNLSAQLFCIVSN